MSYNFTVSIFNTKQLDNHRLQIGQYKKPPLSGKYQNLVNAKTEAANT